MRIKNYLGMLSLAFVLATSCPVHSYAAGAVATTKADPDKDAQTLARITQRVAEIQAMDKTDLSNAEKKSLRKELKQMHKSASGLDSKVYLSVGALIIIILLLILILN